MLCEQNMMYKKCSGKFNSSWIILFFFLGCVAFTTYYHFLLFFPQGAEQNIRKAIKFGSGKYRLDNPSGVKNGKITWSQYGQDLVVDKILQQKRNGFFVEIGGYDGEQFSNTLFLEKERGWSGLLVEANPYTYGIMLQRDRKCFMINACISNTVSQMTFIIAGAITSSNKTLTEKHQRRINTDIKRYSDKNWAHSGESVEVKCYSLNSIMNTLNRNHIDYFSLDVEGAEMLILESIDWRNLTVDLFTIETDQHRDQIINFMKNHGFDWIQRLAGDDVFRKTKN